jgi:hypothetical protein
MLPSRSGLDQHPETLGTGSSYFSSRCTRNTFSLILRHSR